MLWSKYLDKSFPVFHTPLTAGLQPAGQCRRVANPARAMAKYLFWARRDATPTRHPSFG